MGRSDEFQAGRGAVPLAERGSAEYSQRVGRPVLPTSMFRGITVNPAWGRKIGGAYEALPSRQPEAVPSYRAMREETGRQFEFMTGSQRSGGLGLDVQVQKKDPYVSAEAMMRDVHENRRLKIFATGGEGNEHPFFSNDENDMFRAVHDLFGHAGTGRGFDRHGEEAAWAKHSQMYSGLARRAMTAETRGQNSAFIFRRGGQSFPEQKVSLLPQRYVALGATPPLPSGLRPAINRQARNFNLVQFPSLR